MILCAQLPVNRWNTIRPHVIKTGLINRVFRSNDLKFLKIVSIEALVIKLVVVIVENLSALTFDALIFDFIVSNSSSTFLCGPRSHCSDLWAKYIFTNVIAHFDWPIVTYLYASSSRPFNTKKLGVSGT